MNETKRILSRQPGGTNFGNYEVANFHVVNAEPMKKVALFRHPIERLLSGWNQMFQDRCEEPCGKHPVSVPKEFNLKSLAFLNHFNLEIDRQDYSSRVSTECDGRRNIQRVPNFQ